MILKRFKFFPSKNRKWWKEFSKIEGKKGKKYY